MNKGLMYIWSKDRACQLETLLASIYKTSLVQEFDLEIIYKHSSADFRTGYQSLQHSYDVVKWTRQENAKEQFIESAKNYPFTCIMTDDTWVFKNNPQPILDKMDDISVFSMRLGLNTVMQNHFKNEYQPILSSYEDEGETIKWNFAGIHPYYNYGYPFSMDGHVYHSSELVPLLEQIEFNRPPELEGNLLQFRHRLNQNIRSFKHSICVNIPLNTISQNTIAEGPSLEELNHEFLDERRLRFIDEPIVGCHQSVKYKLI